MSCSSLVLLELGSLYKLSTSLPCSEASYLLSTVCLLITGLIWGDSQCHGLRSQSPFWSPLAHLLAVSLLSSRLSPSMDALIPGWM